MLQFLFPLILKKKFMKIKNYTTMKISETFCSLKTTATVLLLGVLLLTNTAVNAQNNTLAFDGVNVVKDYVALPATINNQITTNNITVEGWFYIEALGKEVNLIGEWFDAGVDNQQKFALWSGGGANISATFTSDAGAYRIVTSLNPALDTWVHIAATYDGSNLRLYYNGVQKAVALATEPLPTLNNGIWVLGKNPDFSSTPEFTGKMDEIRIWNVTRTAAEILANYKLQVALATPGLVAYYQMDQGVAGGNNTGITSLANSSSVPSLDGTLIGFALTGSTSNWVETGIPTVYNSGWSQGAPNATRDASIEGNYSFATDLAAKTLTVSNNAVVTIPSGNDVTVTDAVTVNAPATFTLSNDANLVQVNNVANTGAITVNRNSNPLFRLDYTLWSSPVTGQNLLAFSPATIATRFYTYDYALGLGTGLYTAVASPSTTPFTTGTGYLIRMPDADPATDYNSGTGTLAYPGVFTGTANNGTVTLGNPVPLATGEFYAVGNPYPSTISASAFLLGNPNAGGTLYFWRKTNGTPNTSSSYATWTTVGGVAGSNVAPNNVQPDGTIAVGQGFIVNTATATTLNFTNAMRTSSNSALFFKTKRIAEKSRVWLNLTNTTGAFSQALVGFVDGATNGFDNGVDGKYINDSPIALTSNINNEEFSIQGRPAFVPSDVVELNFKTDVAGDFNIAIDHVDGLFSGNQDIYLVDSKTGTETNLKTSSYTFTAAAEVDNTRFSLKFQKTLSLDAQAFNDNSVIVYKNGGVIYVNSGAKMMNNIKVFDIQGRLVAERNNVKANTTSIQNLKASNQVLIVKVTTDDNQVISKKVEN
jgi:hypothetical protein